MCNKRQQKRTPVKILLAVNVNEIPAPSRETQPHLVESNEKLLAKLPQLNVPCTQANIIQPEPQPTTMVPISPPPTVT